MTLTLPAPVVTTPRSAYAGETGRSKKITYTVTEATAEVDGAAVIVSVSHDKGRKAFCVSIQPVTVERSDTFAITKFMGFSGVNVARVPVARFSAKAIEACVAQTIENIPTIVAADPKIAALFTDPAKASNEMFGR